MTQLDVIPAGQLSLFDLAEIANREHALVLEHGFAMVEHAGLAGVALIEAKGRHVHGEWLPWLESNFRASVATAELYMFVARNSERVQNLKGSTSLRQLRKAVKALIEGDREGNYSRNQAGAHEGIEVTEADAEGDGWKLLLGDLADRIGEIPDGSISVIATDPPYPAEYLPLWDELAAAAARVLARGGVLVARCGHLFLPEVLAKLGAQLEYGWVYAEPLPGSNVRFLGRKIAVAYMPWVAFSRGPWPSGRLEWHPDLLSPSQRSKSRYVWEQAPSVAAELIATLAQTGETVLDPFAGSGSYGVAALSVGCRWIGIETDPAGHAQAAKRLREVAP